MLSLKQRAERNAARLLPQTTKVDDSEVVKPLKKVIRKATKAGYGQG